MLWYGHLKTIKQLTSANTKKKKNNAQMRRVTFVLPFRTNYNRTYQFIYVHHYLKLTLLKQCWKPLVNTKMLCQQYFIYLRSIQYFFLITLPVCAVGLFYDSKTNVICFNTVTRTNNYRLFWNFFKKIFNSFVQFFFKKLKVKGKGYYIFKNKRNTVALQLGYSHKVYVYTYFLFVKFLTKTSVLLFGTNLDDLISNSLELFSMRKQNIFTGKGIRFSKQIIYKKPGKVSN